MTIDRMMDLIFNKFQIVYLFLWVTIIGCESPNTHSPLYLPQGFEATVWWTALPKLFAIWRLIKMEICMPNSNAPVRQE